jgi:hypothetical protein
MNIVMKKIIGLGVFFVIVYGGIGQAEESFRFSTSVGLEFSLDIAPFGVEQYWFSPILRFGIDTGHILGASISAGFDIGKNISGPRIAAVLDWYLLNREQSQHDLYIISGIGIGPLGGGVLRPYLLGGIGAVVCKYIRFSGSASVYILGNSSDTVLNAAAAFNLAFH